MVAPTHRHGAITKNAAHKLGVFACITVAGLASRRLLEKGWHLKTREPAPKKPAAPNVSWQEALTWGATTGLMAGVVRTVVRRGYAKATKVTPKEDW